MRLPTTLLVLAIIGSAFLTGNFAKRERVQSSGDTASIMNPLPLPLPPAEEKIDIDYGVPVQYCPGFDSVEVSGQVALMTYPEYNLTTFKLNPEKRWPIASITKLMTASVALENLEPNKIITLSESAVSSEGTVGNFKAGEKFSATDLIRAMLVSSSNDAAEALSEAYGRKEFIDAMQKKANSLGMLDTTFIDPTGLSFVNQSTSYDLLKLLTDIYKNHPDILSLSSKRQVTIKEVGSGQRRTIINIDGFAGDPEFVGGKTGFIDVAGRNFVGLFKIKGQVLFTVVLGSDNAIEDTKILKGIAEACV